MFTVAIITLSDKGAAGLRKDESGPAIKELVEAAGYQVTKQLLLSDDQKALEDALCQIADESITDLILTTGGTGFSPRDHAPEATTAVIQRPVPGIAEAMRAYSMTITKRAMLSRGVSGIRESSLIINLPGSPKAVKESLSYILPALDHGLAILKSEAAECAR